MKIKKIKTDSIAHLSYIVISKNEAAVIDPRRDCEEYISFASSEGAEIKYIFETHRNEDLVTGSRELRRHTGAGIYHGKGIDFEFGSFVKDGMDFEVGELILKTLETPGHTPESISIVIYPDKKTDQAIGVFTGDALFVDDVGRTDFFKDRKEEFAGKLYDSIFDKLLPLGDQVVLYPAHGAGSVCGGGISDREVSTLGMEKIHNPMLQLNREDFIKKKVSEWHQYPPYFEKMEEVNLIGDDKPLKNYSHFKFCDPCYLKENFNDYQVIDIRPCESFLGAHIDGAISLPLNFVGSYAGFYLKYDKAIVLISNSIGSATEYITELQRLGYDNEVRILRGGVINWATSGYETKGIKIVDLNQAKDMVGKSSTTFLDVRKPDEWKDGIIPNARTMFLGDLLQNTEEFNNDDQIVVYCGSGKRATIGASMLQKKGVENLYVFAGSMKAWKTKN